ncbi:hypothetical protein [Cellulophaga baltica]|uniref:hypothetical protein n=1 Tax=Cellulophaga baltica TaxID=76594 RepID=UPI0003F7B76D|nr:hypothetical protein [Cellulophaga baltica]
MVAGEKGGWAFERTNEDILEYTERFKNEYEERIIFYINMIKEGNKADRKILSL